MTTNDKTADKLIDSMRKTKAAAADKSDASQKDAPEPEKKKSQPQAKKKAADKPSVGGARNRSGDPYQSGRRVWPD